MVEWGWIAASFQAGLIIGILLGRWLWTHREPPAPVLRPYNAPVLSRLREEDVPESVLAQMSQAQALKISEAEFQAMVRDIQAETGVDEKTAREEANLILMEANFIGQ
jgi:hypothetical protein